MEKIILVGGGGHAKSVIDTIIRNNEYEIVGILDTKEKISETILGIEIIGTDKLAKKLFDEGITNAFISLGSIGNTDLRRKLAEETKEIGFSFPKIIDKSAVVSNFSKIEEGVFVGKGAIINADVVIKSFSIINTNSVIEHDSVIGEYSHISPSATLCGEVKVGSRSHIGANSTIIQGIKIGSDVLIGAGSTIINDIEDSKVVVGSPGRDIHV